MMAEDAGHNHGKAVIRPSGTHVTGRRLFMPDPWQRRNYPIGLLSQFDWTRGQAATAAHLERNPAAIGAAPDGNKQHLPVTIAGVSELGRHRLPAAGQAPLGVGVDCRHRKNRLRFTLTRFCWLQFCFPHI